MLKIDVKHGHVADVPLSVVERRHLCPIVHVFQPEVRAIVCSSH